MAGVLFISVVWVIVMIFTLGVDKQDIGAILYVQLNKREGVMGISRDKAIELVEEGIVDPIQMVIMCVKYMSEDDVEDMLDCNELSDRFIEEDDGQPTWEQEWADFGEEY